jgi:glycine/D-amino acid oxidase-like deaminating enzyme
MKVPDSSDITSGQNQTPWTDSMPPLFFEKLEGNTEAGTVVVGGGIAGLSVAYMLACEGMDVLVVEDGAIGSGESGRTTAHLVNALDNRYYQFHKKYGEEVTRQIAASHTKAIDEIEKIVRNENIDCGFRRTEGYLFLHPNDDPHSLEEEWEAARKAGLQVEKVGPHAGH